MDYSAYGLDAAQAAVVDGLTPEQLEYAYRKKQREYHVEDAQRHAEVLLDDKPGVFASLDEGDFEIMAKRFEDDHDCNLDDNSQWDNVIWAYLVQEGKA